MAEDREAGRDRVSVVIPARNEGGRIGSVVRTVLGQATNETEVEVIVVDDGSTDGTEGEARAAGARVLGPGEAGGGNPAAARNRGAAAATGSILVFLDADCLPVPGWLAALLGGYRRGIDAVGGSLALPPGLPLFARCDHYCGTYHMHPRRKRGIVGHHTPCNLSVRKEAFAETSRFLAEGPASYAHEELHWQEELRARGGAILFEPSAKVYHHDRPGLVNLLRRNYRWGFSAVEAKAGRGTVRFSHLYGRPWVAVVMSLPLAIPSTVYVVFCWLRVGVYEPLLLFPLVLAARIAYGFGMMIGGIRWLGRRRRASGEGGRDER
ncbi:MAG: glycosyltransferase [Candidatus Eisenbacteria bacterium]